MDVHPSTQIEQHGSGSWHPALRPNAPDSKNYDEVAKPLAPLESATSEEIGHPNALPYQLPIRNKSALQDRSGNTASTVNSFQSPQPAQNFPASVNGPPAEPFPDASPERDHDYSTRQNGIQEHSDEATNNASRALDASGTERMSPHSDSSPTRESMPGESQNSRTNISSSIKAKHARRSIGDQRDMNKVWDMEAKSRQFAGIAGLDRTNSFPAIPPITYNEPIPAHPLPQSQAEEILDEETQSSAQQDWSSDIYSPIVADQAMASTPVGSATAQEEGEEEGKEDLLASPQQSAANIDPVEAEAESRYEEGVPLMAQSMEIESSGLFRNQDNEKQPHHTAQTDDEDDFFDRQPSTIEPNEAFQKPHPLDRKSTTQVLNSIVYPPHGTTHVESSRGDERNLGAGLDEKDSGMTASTASLPINVEQDISSGTPKSKDEDLAELWKAALADDDLFDEDVSTVDPSAFFGDDAEGFLEDSQDQAKDYRVQSQTSTEMPAPSYGQYGVSQASEDRNPKQMGSQAKYLPATSSQAAPLQQLAPPDSSHFMNLIPQPSFGLQPQSRPQMPASTQSFADKSKGGYTSPYDLPIDVTRPKKRTTLQQTRLTSEAQPALNRPPPPRSSSMFTGVAPHLGSQPPVPPLPSAYPSSQAPSVAPSIVKASPSSGFFEELPSSKARPTSSAGRFAPAPHQISSPPLPVQRETAGLSSANLQPSSNVSQQHGLLPPDKTGHYSNAGQAETNYQAIPATNPRYSPAPPQTPVIPPPRNRYAASPSAGNRLPSQTLPFQPRTSSPLAQNHVLPHQQQQQQQAVLPEASLHRPSSSSTSGTGQNPNIPSPSYPFPLQHDRQAMYQGQNFAGTATEVRFEQSPPPLGPTQDEFPTNVKPESFKAIAPQEMIHPVHYNPPFIPPRRSQTQSPGAGKYAPEPVHANVPYQRPASVNHQMSLQVAETNLPLNFQGRPRGTSLEKITNYIKPSDGREFDPLERWKGCPIISYGFGGAIVTSFPKQVPRYAAGQSTPLIKCSPGEVKLQGNKLVSLDEEIAKFPGPLKSKNKKKDVLDWLQKRILKLEVDAEPLPGSNFLPDVNKRREEKILLWKVVRLLVEYDGIVEGNVENAARSILSPELAQGDAAAVSSQSTDSNILGISQHGGPHGATGLARPGAIEEVRKLLMHGGRERAVWHAVDNQLWAHAMLLASTLDKTIWKQVSQEFVRQEVKTYGTNTEALAALYQVFAGNWEESADELVPPSARAGLQMVSKTTSTGPTKNALDGLDRWRETVTLILSNRTPDDGKALVNLGQLLASYGRVEAAHICYTFAKSPSLFGGPDDPQVAVALLGSDHLQQPFEYGQDLDSILLTEVFDFARTILTSSSVVTASPHLQSFKLYHAMILAESGLKTEAQLYCESITSTFNATTKRSPYYHGQLLGALEDLIERLRQAPRDSSGSWISKPSIDKVSGSIWAKFNQYVAGDESDAASTGSGKAHDGPFAGVNGDSPTLSRATSTNDLYNAYTPGIVNAASTPISNPSNARYTPSGVYNSRPSNEEQGRAPQDAQRPYHNDFLRPAVAQQQYQSRPSSSVGSRDGSHKLTPLTAGYPSRMESYIPALPQQPQMIPAISQNDPASSLYNQELDQQFAASSRQSNTTDMLHTSIDPSRTHELSSSIYNPPSAFTQETPSINGDEPNTSSGYDPPSYEPVSYEAQQSPVEEKRKKKSFIDDDDEDDFEARASALRREEKLRKDREADDAFKRAAEADAQKDTAPKLKSQKSGWFGGLFKGKKEGGEDAHGTPNAPIKAKLGEQSSFYYDSEQKRWVNKKDPDATPAVKAAPPPPKGPPSRAVSAADVRPPSSMATPPVPPLPAMMTTPPVGPSRETTSSGIPPSNPPSRYPSRSPSPAIANEPTIESAAARSISASGPPSGPPSAPPSRPATAMSGVSSIDDLIGVPQARKGGTVKKGKKGRGYVDVMAK